jgi:hypothetical protein
MKRVILIIVLLSLSIGMAALGHLSAAESTTSESMPLTLEVPTATRLSFEERTEQIRAEESVRRALLLKNQRRRISTTDLENQLIQAIIRLQPTYTHKRHHVRRLASIILEPAAEYAVNPFIALAVAMKESSLLAVGVSYPLLGAMQGQPFASLTTVVQSVVVVTRPCMCWHIAPNDVRPTKSSQPSLVLYDGAEAFLSRQ